MKVLAQHSIEGQVLDSEGKPLKSVSVRLVSDIDTLNQITNTQGFYKFSNFKGNTAYLTYSMLGYKNDSRSFFLIGSTNFITASPVRLEATPLTIQDVRVHKIVPIVINGDTIQFNFSAFDIRKNALLEEGLQRLPGFQVARDGLVYYNGQLIRKVKVDNRDFFGGDVLTATRNLPADYIQNLQVIDSYGEEQLQSGIKTGQSEKIINITLKEDKKQIYFGQVTVGMGTNERYLGSIGLNKFDNGREFSMVGSMNNTNTNLISFGTLSAGVDRERNTLEIGDYADPIDGLNTVQSFGLNITDKIGQSTNFNVQYNLLNQRNQTTGFSNLISTYVGNTIRRKEDYQLESEDVLHKLKVTVDQKFANKDLLKIVANASMNRKFAETFNNLNIENYNKANLGVYEDSAKTSTPSGEIMAYYSKYFKKPKRKLIGSLQFNGNLANQKSVVQERYQEIINDRLIDSVGIYRQNQYIHQKNASNSQKASISFTEPFFDYSLFEFNYEFDITNISATRHVEDRLNPDFPTFIDSLRVDYDYYFRSNKTGITYQYEPSKRLRLNFGFSVQPVVMKGNLLNDQTEYTYENINLIPTALFKYQFGKDMDWQLDYKGRNNQPQFYQIAPVVDNTNSRHIIIGNPSLKAEFAHRLSTTFRKTIASKMQYLETNFVYNIIYNKIVSDKTSEANSTIQQTTFRNTDGYYDWKWFYTFNTPIFTDDWHMDVTGSMDKYHNLSYIDDRKRTTNQFIFNQSLQLKYQWSDYVESLFSSNYVWNKASYDLPYRTIINVETLFLGLGAKGYIADDFSIGFEMSQRYNHGYANSFMNVNQTVMNAYLEYTFLKNKRALLRVQGFDLFDQNRNMGIYAEYIGNDVYEARNNRLGRYFMVSLNMRLQKLVK